MTTPIVQSLTDEMLQEIERASEFTKCFMVEVQPASLRALLSERAALKADADRYRTLRNSLSCIRGCTTMEMPMVVVPFTDFKQTYMPEGLDKALDKARRSLRK